MKISATVIEIQTFNKWSSKVYRFKKHRPTFHEIDSHVSIDYSPCPWDYRDAESWNFEFHITFAMASKQPWCHTGGLCNLGAAGARLLHANLWRRPPRWATSAGVVQIWPRDHQCCSYSVASSSACTCEDRQRTLWTLLWQLINDRTASLEITERVVRVVAVTCVFCPVFKTFNKIWLLHYISTIFCTQCTNMC